MFIPKNNDCLPSSDQEKVITDQKLIKAILKYIHYIACFIRDILEKKESSTTILLTRAINDPDTVGAINSITELRALQEKLQQANIKGRYDRIIEQINARIELLNSWAFDAPHFDDEEK